MKLVIGADKAGFSLLCHIKAFLDEAGISYDDIGAKSAADEKIYWQTATEAARGIQEGRYDKGVLCCGTGMGMSIVANKFEGVYAACCESVYAAKKCRVINDAHLLCMGAFLVGGDMGVEMVKTFLNTAFTQDTDNALCAFLKENAENVCSLEKTLF